MAFVSRIMVKHSILNNVIRFQHIQQKDDNCVLLTNFITFIKSFYFDSQPNTKINKNQFFLKLTIFLK
jgi:hypothetical protein